jgi:hypothetical protein
MVPTASNSPVAQSLHAAEEIVEQKDAKIAMDYFLPLRASRPSVQNDPGIVFSAARAGLTKTFDTSRELRRPTPRGLLS